MMFIVYMIVLSGIVFGQTLPQPIKLTKVSILTRDQLLGNTKTIPPATTLTADEKTRMSWLKAEKVKIGKLLNANKISVAQKIQQETDADYFYFKSKFGNVQYIDFKAVKDFIISNGYTDITEVLSLFSLLDWSAITFDYGYASSFISVDGNRIIAFCAYSFSKVTQLRDLNRLTRMEYLEVWMCPVADGNIETLQSLKDLRTLMLGSTFISDLKGVDTFKNLEVLTVSNKITDFAKVTVLDRLFVLNPKRIRLIYLNANPVYANAQFISFKGLHPEIQ